MSLGRNGMFLISPLRVKKSCFSSSTRLRIAGSEGFYALLSLSLSQQVWYFCLSRSLFNALKNMSEFSFVCHLRAAKPAISC